MSRAKVTKLRGDELPVTDEMRAQAFWLVRKYTSHAYIERMIRLYSSFVHGYEEYAKTNPPKAEPAFLRESLAILYWYLGHLETGLDLLERGVVCGYDEVGEGLAVDAFFHPRRREEMLWEIIGQRGGHDQLASVGLYAWIEHALNMLARVEMALGVECAFPGIIQGPLKPSRFPSRLDPLPKPTGLRLENGQEVPVTGIWIPLDIPCGCPNFFRAGGSAYPGLRLAKSIFRPAYRGNQDSIVPAMTIYEYERTPTRWELVWEDRRYQGGALPDESEYLDRDDLAAFPPYPPRHQPG